MDAAWVREPGKVYEWVWGTAATPLVMVADPEAGGRPCASVPGMDRNLHAA